MRVDYCWVSVTSWITRESHFAFQKVYLLRHSAINLPLVSLVLYLTFLMAFSIF